MYLIRGRVDVGHRCVVIHKIYDRSDEFAHIGFYIVCLVLEHGRLIAQVRGDDSVKITLLIGFVKGFQSVREKPECTADEDPLGPRRVHWQNIRRGQERPRQG